jgi:flagellar protein FliL
MAKTEQNAAEAAENEPKKKKMLPLLLGLVGAAALGGAAFFAVYSGLILGPKAVSAVPAANVADFAFVPIDQITVSLASGSQARHLRFSAQIEVAATSVAEVERLRPRLLDMMNLYLRAVDPADLADPAALIRLRAQLLRRLQVIVGDGHVRDVLITEFVLS